MSRQRQIAATGRTILVVDDQSETLESVRELLRREGHRVLVADSGARALALLGSERVHVMLVDYFMPIMNGELLVRAVRERDTLVQIILQTGYAGEKPPREMLHRLDIQGYHDKGDGPERLLVWVDVALKAYDALAERIEAERLKTELLASVSHELRTPLNVIVGYVDVLRDGDDGLCTPAADPFLDKVRGNATSLLALVEEMLVLAQLEIGMVRVEAEPVDVAGLVAELTAAAGVGDAVELCTAVPADLPPVAAERAKLRIVLGHLIANAVRFTTAGRIEILAEPIAAGHVAIHVRDTGPGIAPENQTTIFDPFRQLPPPDGGTKGIGLGLALARRFARLMGGDLGVQSALGAGSTFTVTLPVGTPTLAAAEQAAA